MSESPQKKQKCPEGAIDWSAMMAKPKAQHDFLKSMAGTWNAKVYCYHDPSKPEGEVIDARVIYTSKYNGLFLDGKWYMYGPDKKVSMEGQDLIGFESARGEFYMTWVDTFTDILCYSRGKQEGDIIHFNGIKDDVMSGKKDQPFRQTYNVKTHTMEMFKPKDDNDKACGTLCMTITKELVPGPTTVSFFSILVTNYDAAIKFYTEKLGFHLHTDMKHGDDFRWVVVQSPGDGDFRVNLLEASTDEEKARVGKQGSSKGPFFYLGSLDCKRDYELLHSRGVEFTQKPTDQFYGIDAHFKDLYGNAIGLCQVKPH